MTKRIGGKPGAVLFGLLVAGLLSQAGYPAARRPPTVAVTGGSVFCEPNNIDEPDGGRWFPNPPGCPAGWHQS